MSQKESSLQTVLDKQRNAAAHRQRCRGLPPLRRGEAEQLVARFLADRQITQCPTVYLVPIR
jgi:hypothetical protein